jgi:hypothetical protein
MNIKIMLKMYLSLIQVILKLHKKYVRTIMKTFWNHNQIHSSLVNMD